jgi:hypothetical protein
MFPTFGEFLVQAAEFFLGIVALLGGIGVGIAVLVLVIGWAVRRMDR